MSFLGDLVAAVGNKAGIGELGISERFGSTGTVPTTQQNVANGLVFGPGQQTAGNIGTGSFSNPISGLVANNGIGSVGSNIASAAGNAVSGSGGSGVSAADLAYLDDQRSQLQSLLGRTETGLNQGLTQNQDGYDRQLGAANATKAKQLAAYGDQEVAQNQGKLNTYDTINKNANNGFRSLSQIIGRASGTGSSAFRDLLPNVIGTDISSKRADANETYGANLAGIDKARSQYDIDFGGVLEDLLRQKRDNESTLRSGIEGQRQTINSQLATNAGQKAQAQGGGYEAVRSAQAPFQSAIDNSRNQVESFFNQFRTAYTPRQAVASAPELADYTVDRSVINAQNQGASDSTNPYAALLKKRIGAQ